MKIEKALSKFDFEFMNEWDLMIYFLYLPICPIERGCEQLNIIYFSVQMSINYILIYPNLYWTNIYLVRYFYQWVVFIYTSSTATPQNL